MESLLRDAFKNTPPQPPSSTFYLTKNEDIDDEIVSILKSSLPRIRVIGIGGAGNNAVHRLNHVGIRGAETAAVNTDAQHLLNIRADKKLLIGKTTTRGFGAGNNPDQGHVAAKESVESLESLVDADLVFITCGLGGGTGTGAGPFIAKLAREKGALTVSVCTLPFRMEGAVRIENAIKGLRQIYEASDTVIVVPNEKLLQLSSEITMIAAFKIADEILVRAVKGITELITTPQLINLDFADVRRILGDGRVAMIGMGEIDTTKSKVDEAVLSALSNPLLNDLDISTAKKALVCVLGGVDLTLRDAERIVLQIGREIEKGAEVIWGVSICEELGKTVRVIVLLSDVSSPYLESETILCGLEDLYDITNVFPQFQA
ncbi:MAG: cell division protein FtsZ [Promethearchaeota archaeon]